MAPTASLNTATWAQPPLALLVDRDGDTRRMYAEYLTRSSCRVEEAEDGREALALAVAHHPDIVITETRLAGIDGISLCNLLRTDPATAQIAIVFVTGDGRPGDVSRAEDAGADAILVKPCLPDRLFSEMRRLLDESKMLRQRSREMGRLAGDQVSRSAAALDRAGETIRRLTLSRAHARRATSEPPVTPPVLVCPVCDHALRYERSHIGGVNAQHAEQWDYFDCTNGCGTFQYRQRTRKLRKVA